VFFRSKKVKDGDRVYEYVQLVESYRDEEGITRQRVIKSLGRREELGELAASFAKFAPGVAPSRVEEAAAAPRGEDAIDVLESRRFGDVFVLRRLWVGLGLGGIFEELAASREFQFDPVKALFTMVANRALDPRSKLDTIEWAKLDVLLPEAAGLTETHLYRTLTWLNDMKAEAEEAIFKRVVSNRSKALQLVLYDTSAVHFETPAGPPLAQHGRPSRGPRGEKIMLVALVTTFDGWPIYHRVFPGSTADVSTVEEVFTDLRNRFGLERVVVVADNGFVSAKTLALLEKLRFDYLVAMKLKNSNEVCDDVLGRAGRYQQVDPNLRVKEVVIDERVYVVCHNPEEDARDKERRRGMLGALKQKLAVGVPWDTPEGAAIRSNAAWRRYVTRGRGKSKGLVVLSKTRIEEDERYDGKWVVRTSRTDLNPEDVATQFKRLNEIERDWRDLKSVLGLRPVRHFTDHNVRGHVFVCVLAKLLHREIQRRLDAAFAPVGGPPTVLENLGRIPAVLLQTPHSTFWRVARLKVEDEALLRVLALDPASVPRNVEAPAVMPSRFAAPEFANFSIPKEE
jgi:hypothetical protein